MLHSRKKQKQKKQAVAYPYRHSAAFAFSGEISENNETDPGTVKLTEEQAAVGEMP